MACLDDMDKDKSIMIGKRPEVCNSGNTLALYLTIPSLNHVPHNQDFLTTLVEKTFENIVGKGENAGNQQFLLKFPSSLKQITAFDND